MLKSCVFLSRFMVDTNILDKERENNYCAVGIIQTTQKSSCFILRLPKGVINKKIGVLQVQHGWKCQSWHLPIVYYKSSFVAENGATISFYSSSVRWRLRSSCYCSNAWLIYHSWPERGATERCLIASCALFPQPGAFRVYSWSESYTQLLDLNQLFLLWPR